MRSDLTNDIVRLTSGQVDYVIEGHASTTQGNRIFFVGEHC
jgi:hypothetical protein